MRESFEDYLSGWKQYADQLNWVNPPITTWREGIRGGTWFPDGSLSVYDNCIGRHLPHSAGLPAIHWEGEPGDRRTLTYEDLAEDVDRLARGLRGLGVARGDRVGMHLGWIPETVIAMLACARLGATYMILATALPVEALALRLSAFAPKVLITQDGAWRRGTIVPLKARVDDALGSYDGVEHTIVVRRTGIDVEWFEGDLWYSDAVDGPRDEFPPAVAAQGDPLFSISLANRGGRPASLLHSATTTMAVAHRMHRNAICAGDVLWVVGDASWMANSVHGIYGPLLWGETAVMYEGTVDFPVRVAGPGAGRLWGIIEHFDVSTMLMPPTVGLALRELGAPPPRTEGLGRLLRIVTIGDGPGDELPQWLFKDIGHGQVEVADGWGQMELCGVVLVDRPPAGQQMPDVAAEVLPLPTGHGLPETASELVLERPWPGMSANMQGEHAEELSDSHWASRPGVYATGDLATQTPAGQLRFLGRIDEVASVSGQLVSLREVGEMLLEHPFVSEAEVVAYRDARYGSSVAAVVVLNSQAPALENESVHHQLRLLAEDVLGGIARPRKVMILDEFRDNLSRADRRRALAIVATSSASPSLKIHWSQVEAVAHSDGTGDAADDT